jgi:hypothetical protein
MTITTLDGRSIQGGAALPVAVLNEPIAVSASGTFATTPAVAAASDVFGNLRVADPQIVYNWSPSYGLDPLRWEARTSGGGNTATWSSDTRMVSLTLAAAGYVVRQSYSYVPYQPGRGVRVICTGAMGAAVAGVLKEFGQGDAANGLFWRQGTDGTLSVVRRSSTSGAVVDEVIPRSAWNGDRLDGAGISGVSLNITTDQVWVIEYAWLGTAVVRWGVYANGAIVYCHTRIYANDSPVSYMQTASLPFRWLISAAGAPGATATLTQVCAALISEGGYFVAPSYPFSAGRPIASAISVATEVPLAAIRPRLTLGGIPNRVFIEIADIADYSSAGPADWRLLYYPPGSVSPITGGAWASPSTESAVEANVSGTALSLTGAIEIARGYLGASTGASSRIAAVAQISQLLPLTLDMAGANDPRTSNVGANPAYLVLSALGNNPAVASGSILWRETR